MNRTLRERIFGPGALYEGGAPVPLRVLVAKWVVRRLYRVAHRLTMWGHRQAPGWEKP